MSDRKTTGRKHDGRVSEAASIEPNTWRSQERRRRELSDGTGRRRTFQ
jgi:hypothetical protein